MPSKTEFEPARSILTPTSGFIREAGFTHSLTPARNCTFGCSYCYVPTMGIYGGLKPGDAAHWGQRTTFKSNAAELLKRALKPDQIIYCSPLVDPFQPAEASLHSMRQILHALADSPPRVFVLQTRSAKILSAVEPILRLSRLTKVRVSFSITTDDDAIRRAYEPHCDSIERRFETLQLLVQQGIETFATLAPLLPCDPDRLLDRVLQATPSAILCDPLHNRELKPRGATTREAAVAISRKLDHAQWHNPAFQQFTTERMRARAAQSGRRFATGPAAFRFLAET